MNYQSNKNFTTITLILFSLYSIVCFIIPFIGISILTLFHQLNMTGNPDTQAKFNSLTSYYDKLTIFSVIIFFLAGISFIFWIYRANANAHVLYKDHKFKFTPAWAVAAFFIPILQLFWPYQVVKELWQTSHIKIKIPIILIWWLSFLLFNIIGRIVAKIPADTPAHLNMYMMIDTLSNMFGILSAILAMVIVKWINSAQKRVVD